MTVSALIVVAGLHLVATIGAARTLEWAQALMLAGFTIADVGMIWLALKR
jgi:hypothetical protein